MYVTDLCAWGHSIFTALRRVTWPISISDITHSYKWPEVVIVSLNSQIGHVLFVCMHTHFNRMSSVKWVMTHIEIIHVLYRHLYTWDIVWQQRIWHASFTCSVWHDSHLACLIHMQCVTRLTCHYFIISSVWHDVLTFLMWRYLFIWRVWHDSFEMSPIHPPPPPPPPHTPRGFSFSPHTYRNGSI